MISCTSVRTYVQVHLHVHLSIFSITNISRLLFVAAALNQARAHSLKSLCPKLIHKWQPSVCLVTILIKSMPTQGHAPHTRTAQCGK